MEKIVKVKFSELTSLNATELVAKGGTIYQALNQNATEFPACPFAPSALNTALGSLSAINSLANGDAGSKNTRNERDLQSEGVLNMLLVNGSYVATIANTQETYEERKAMVELGGYSVANDTHNPVPVVQVTDLAVVLPTAIGERTVKVRWKRGQCDTFIVEGTQDSPTSPSAVWAPLLISNKAKCELTLEPGTWSIRVIGVYSSGQAEPSVDVSFMLS